MLGGKKVENLQGQTLSAGESMKKGRRSEAAGKGQS